MQEKIQEWNRATVPPSAARQAWGWGGQAGGEDSLAAPADVSGFSVPECRVK